MFDVVEKEKQAEVEEIGTDVEIKDERGKPVVQEDGKTPVTIKVVGSLSRQYRKVQKVARGRVLKGGAARSKDADEETIGARNFDEQTDAIADCILGWSAGITANGSPFPFSKENAVRLLKACPYIQSQLETAMDDHARFFTSPSAG